MAWIAFATCFLIFNIRAFHRAKFANLWAEDGVIYATEAFRMGWKSLFHPIVGYQTFIQRLIAWLGLAVPLDQYALFFLQCYLICASAVLAYLVHEDFEHLVPSKKGRIFLAICLCFVGGLGESLGNLCNLHWFFSLALGFLLMRKLESKTSGLHIAWAALLALSAAESVLFIPFFLFRIWLKKKYLKKWDLNEVWISVPIFVVAGINYLFRDPAYFNTDPIPIPSFALSSVYTLVNHFMLEPILGGFATNWVGSNELTFWFSACVMFLIYSKTFFKNTAINDRLTYLAVLPFIGTTFLSWIVRKNAFSIFFHRQRDPVEWWHMARYTLNMAPIALILSMTQLPRLSKRFNYKLFYILGILFIVKSSYYFEIFQNGSQVWSEKIRKITSGQVNCDKLYHIDSDPSGWGADIPGQALCDFKNRWSPHEP